MNATRAQLHINIYMFIASKFLNKLRKRVLSFCLNTIFPPFVFFTLFRTCVRAYVRFFFFLSVSPFLGAVRSLYLLIPAFNVFFYHLRTSAGQSPSSSPKVSAELTLPKGECWTVGLWQQWHRWQTQRNYSMPSARRIRALSQARIVECLDSTSGVLVNG